jgi:hypothetical protein
MFYLGVGLGDYHRSDHHLVPSLIAPVDAFRRIGVSQVLGRVIKVGIAFDNRPGGEELRLGQSVGVLPVEIVLGHVEQNFFLAVGIGGRKSE